MAAMWIPFKNKGTSSLRSYFVGMISIYFSFEGNLYEICIFLKYETASVDNFFKQQLLPQYLYLMIIVSQQFLSFWRFVLVLAFLSNDLQVFMKVRISIIII